MLMNVYICQAPVLQYGCVHSLFTLADVFDCEYRLDVPEETGCVNSLQTLGGTAKVCDSRPFEGREFF